MSSVSNSPTRPPDPKKAPHITTPVFETSVPSIVQVDMDVFQQNSAVTYNSLTVLLKDLFGSIQQLILPITTAVKELQVKQDSLAEQMKQVSERVDKLLAGQPPAARSFASVVGGGSTAAQVQLVRKAVREESQDELRKKRVFIKHVGEKEDDAAYMRELCSKLDLASPVEVFRVGHARQGDQPPRPLICEFPSENDVYSFLKKLHVDIRANKLQVSARPDYSPSEMSLYKAAWKEAISRNDAAKKRQWTVRNCKLVKLETATEWTPRGDQLTSGKIDLPLYVLFDERPSSTRGLPIKYYPRTNAKSNTTKAFYPYRVYATVNAFYPEIFDCCLTSTFRKHVESIT